MHCMREPRRVPVSAAIRLQTTALGSLAATVVVGAAGAGRAVEAGAAGCTKAGAVAGVDDTAVAGALAASVSAAIEDEAEKATIAVATNPNMKLRKVNPLYCFSPLSGDQVTRMRETVQAQLNPHKQ